TISHYTVAIHSRLGLLTTRNCVAFRLIGIVVHVVISINYVAAVTPGTVHALAGLLNRLLTVRHDDAIVVLGVLQVIFCQYWITRSKRVTRQGHILFSNVRRRTPDLHIRTV